MLKTVQSVERALHLLEVVDAAGSKGVGCSELASDVGLKTPTTHNLLNTLLVLGYVRRDEGSKRYSLGNRALALGRGRTAMNRLAAMARRPLMELNDAVNETVILAVCSERQRHTIVSLESQHDLRVGAATGVDGNFYDTATGRALLAQLSDDERTALCEDLGAREGAWPEARTEAQFSAALAGIVEAGAVMLHKDHVEALAVPLDLPSGGLPAALGVYYPAVRGNEQRREKLVDALRRTAGIIQRNQERNYT
ncbi:MAG: IclR family transcriptional regulator [Candidatus Pacebacteria bacterium]|nr:IclR family transcriptional regulator [Candidatus Paceibacterota bacterium]